MTDRSSQCRGDLAKLRRVRQSDEDERDEVQQCRRRADDVEVDPKREPDCRDDSSQQRGQLRIDALSALLAPYVAVVHQVVEIPVIDRTVLGQRFIGKRVEFRV
jgi:hypothetical protein